MSLLSVIMVETLYYRPRTDTSEAADGLASSVWGSPVAYLGDVEGWDGVGAMDGGQDDKKGGRIQSEVPLLRSYLYFGPGDDGSDLSTGRIAKSVSERPLGFVGFPGTTIYLVGF